MGTHPSIFAEIATLELAELSGARLKPGKNWHAAVNIHIGFSDT